MKEFTFVIITYNHEKYILEHLESIKYQIQHYGKDYKISLLVCDDCSNDNTIEMIKKWINKNNIFNDCKFVIAKENGGTVKNFISAMHEVKTDNFKELAGDDVYYKNNIFEVLENKMDLVVSPIIRINETETIKKSLKREYFVYLHIKKLTKKMRYIMRYTMPFHTPGVFWNHKLYNKVNEKELTNYKFIEDVPLFSSLLNIKNLESSYSEKPYILYRTTEGISHSVNNSKRNNYEIEHKKLYEDYWYRNNMFLKKIIFKIRIKIYENIYTKFKKSKLIGEAYLKEIEIANDYYSIIRKNVEGYLCEK